MIIPLNLGYVTVFALKGTRTVLVDTAVAGREDAVLEELSRHGVRPDDVSLILVTHGHTDHFGGAALLHELTGAPVGAHREDAEYVRRGVNPPVCTTSAVSGVVKDLIDDKAARSIRPCAVDVLLGDGASLGPYGVEAGVVHTPGHTAGSLSVVACTEAIVGDLVMGTLANARVPRWPFFADDLGRVKESLRMLVERGVERFFASHGGPFSRRSLLRLLRET